MQCEYTTFACGIAREAGELLLQYQQSGVEVQSKSNEIDLVTTADRASETLLIGRVRERFPEHQILAEEDGALGDASALFRWVLDPLDGTVNFAHGQPHFCVLVSLETLRAEEWVPIACATFDPHRNEMFSASEGRGAYLNNKRIRVSTQEFLKSCLITTGFPTGEKQIQAFYNEKLQKFLDSEVNFRRTGSAALDLCYVAAGRTDGFFEKGLKAWDMAAGSLMVKEAGGFVGDFSNNQEYLYSGDVIAANPKLFPTILKILTSSSV